MNATNGASINITNLALGGTNGLGTNAGSTITIGPGITFNALGSVGMSASGGIIYVASNYTILGGSIVHMQAVGGGQIYALGNYTVTLTGSPAFSSAFAQAISGQVQISDATGTLSFSGGATGPRYFASLGGVVATGSGNVNYIPGSVAGNSTTGYYT